MKMRREVAALHPLTPLAAMLTALALLEPALIALLTTIVGFVALSFFLPLMQLLGGLNSH